MITSNILSMQIATESHKKTAYSFAENELFLHVFYGTLEI